MSITFPTFIDKEIVPPQKLNDFVQALEAKFTAGLGSAEIAWPLISGGDLYMNDYSIIGGSEVLGMINAGAPKYATDFATALIDGANGCIFIPPNTTITIDGEEFSGNSLTIIGSGPTSVLRLSASASAGFMLRNTTAGCTVRMTNLTLDGNGETGSGLNLRGCHDVVLDALWFTDFSDSGLVITDLSGAASERVSVEMCHFSGGSGYHVELDDCIDVDICHNTFDSASEIAVNGVAADTNADMRRIHVNDNKFSSCVKGAVNMRGAGAFNIKWSGIEVCGNTFDATSMTSTDIITLGTVGAQLQYIKCSGNTIPSGVANAITCSAQYGTIADNTANKAGVNGLDMLTSEDIVVHGNNFRDSVGVGIVFDDTVDCTIRDNDTGGSGTEIQQGEDTTSTYYANGPLTVSAPPINGYFNLGSLVTIPANTLKVGDVLWIMGNRGEATTGTGYIRFNGSTVANCVLDESDGIVSMQAMVVITSDTTARSIGMGLSVTKLADHGVTGASLTGLDLTQPIEVTIVGPSGTAYGLFVQLGHVEIQA